MNNIPNYNKATNAAYEVLKRYYGSYPQIDVYKLLTSNSNIKVHTYSEAADMNNMSFSDFFNSVGSNDGFTMYNSKKEKWIVLYNEKKCEQTIRFTLAHELGHIILRHMKDNDVAKSEANCFARNLLCPVPIREDFHLKTCEDYCSWFNISEPMAIATKGNHSSDMYYISKDNYNAISLNSFFHILRYTPATSFVF